MSSRRMSGVGRVAAAGLLVGLAACSTSAQPSVTAGPQGSGDPSDSPPCQPISLLAPDGSQVRLTGTWTGFLSSTWIVTQSGGCVTIEGYRNPTTSSTLGEDMRAAFSGNLASDFTIAGRFTWTYGGIEASRLPPGQTVSMTLHVIFAANGDPLIEIDPADLRIYRDSPPLTENLVRISTSTSLPEP